MLDLEALLAGMDGLAEEVVRSAEQSVALRETARAQLEVARSLEGLREAVERSGADMALPAAGRDPGRTCPAPEAGDYVVAATDGSQIAPDYHHVAPWYALNVGCAVLRYGIPGRPRCRLASFPILRPPRRGSAAAAPEEPDSAADALAAAVALPGQLEVERLKEELRLACRLLDEEGEPGRTVLLLDGPLVQWRMVTNLHPPGQQEEVIGVFRNLLAAARERKIPVAGYISRSRAVEWITLLRFTLCPNVAAEGRLCGACEATLLKRYSDPEAGAGTHHAALAGLRDIELAALLLPERGMRTEVLELRSRSWNRLSGGDGAAGFFYLNAGPEIGRVELPSWVWEDPEALELLHAVLWDQCEAGRGYPMVLAEAHEQAVVRAADRAAFYAAIERILNARRVYGAAPSAKAVSKRRPAA